MGEITVAKERGVFSLNARNAVTNSTRRLKGWNDTYAPKNQKVKVADWLRDNKFHVSEDNAKDMGDMTFADIKRQGMESVGWLDTFLRDAIYDGMNSLKRK